MPGRVFKFVWHVLPSHLQIASRLIAGRAPDAVERAHVAWMRSPLFAAGHAAAAPSSAGDALLVALTRLDQDQATMIENIDDSNQNGTRQDIDDACDPAEATPAVRDFMRALASSTAHASGAHADAAKALLDALRRAAPYRTPMPGSVVAAADETQRILFAALLHHFGRAALAHSEAARLVSANGSSGSSGSGTAAASALVVHSAAPPSAIIVELWKSSHAARDLCSQRNGALGRPGVAALVESVRTRAAFLGAFAPAVAAVPLPAAVTDEGAAAAAAASDMAPPPPPMMRAPSLQRQNSNMGGATPGTMMMTPSLTRSSSVASSTNSTPFGGHTADASNAWATVQPLSVGQRCWARVRALLKTIVQSARAVGTLRRLFWSARRREQRSKGRAALLIETTIAFLTNDDISVRGQ